MTNWMKQCVHLDKRNPPCTPQCLSLLLSLIQSCSGPAAAAESDFEAIWWLNVNYLKSWASSSEGISCSAVTANSPPTSTGNGSFNCLIISLGMLKFSNQEAVDFQPLLKRPSSLFFEKQWVLLRYFQRCPATSRQVYSNDGICHSVILTLTSNTADHTAWAIGMAALLSCSAFAAQ